MTKPLKTFFITASVLFAVICLGECVVLSRSGGSGTGYWSYLLFLLLAGLGGAMVISAHAWVVSQKESRDLRLQKIRIAELERSMENLENVASQREEFIASFAHELKTPLTAIIGYADMLRSKDMAPKARFTAAGYIFSEGKRLEALSLKLMDIIVAGKQGFEKKRYEVGYFIRSIAAVTVPSLSNNGMTLDMRWEPGEIEIEPDLFKTLMINLVDNARKASRKGGVVELFGKSEEGGYAL